MFLKFYFTSFLVLFIFSFYLFNSTSFYKFKIYTMINACFMFLSTVYLWVSLNSFGTTFQYLYVYNWVTFLFETFVTLGVDSFSTIFLVLTNILFLLSLMSIWFSLYYYTKEAFLLLFFVIININLSFLFLDLFYFYIFFEMLLIPMFILIGVWGSRLRRIDASYQFFFFTLIGSILTILLVTYIYNIIGSTNLIFLYHLQLSSLTEIYFFFPLFLAFAVKIPLYPVHIWLPEAHVEAPTFGSVILAGILLKLGGYGFIRFLFPFLTEASFFYQPFILLLSSLGVFYGSLMALTQIDIKKIIAYASVAHMNFVVVGFFLFNLEGWVGSIYLMLAHGLVSSALFLIIGILYDRYKTRIINYFQGFLMVMPLFTIFVFLFSLANMSFPGSANFIGEFLIFCGVMKINFYLSLFLVISTIFGALYSLWFFNRICFYHMTKYVLYFSDIVWREFFYLFIFLFLTFYWGIDTSSLLEKINFLMLHFLNICYNDF